MDTLKGLSFIVRTRTLQKYFISSFVLNILDCPLIISLFINPNYILSLNLKVRVLTKTIEAMTISISLIIEGSFFTAANPDNTKYGADSLIIIDQHGFIDRIVPARTSDFNQLKQQAIDQDKLLQLDPNEYVLPGFIDLHIHAPQWPNAGIALDRPLNEWLNTYTFPLEARYRDLAFAEQVYNQLVSELLANGTTTALYFGTIDNPTNLTLAKACITHHQRGFIGKVAMDNPAETPDNYRDSSAQAAIDDTEAFIHQLADLNQTASLKQTAVITPRFVPSCTPAALDGLGQLARQYDLPVQSHCSESDWEDHYALEHYQMRDAEVLDHYGLLTDKAIMAHGTRLNQTDLDLFKQRGTAVAHCPISNAYFGNAVLPVSQLLSQSNKVGLGTDISGGYSPSLYQNIRQAVVSSHMLHDGVNPQLSPQKRGTAYQPITAKNGFYLATVGGAESLHLPTGKIEPGYLADLQVVRSPLPLFTEETSETIFEKLIYHVTKNDIKQVFIQGAPVLN